MTSLDQLISEIFLGDSGNGFFIENGRSFYLKGIASRSVSVNGTCDIASYALFTSILPFRDWIKNPEKESDFRDEPTCGVMNQSTGLIADGNYSTREQFPWEVLIYKKFVDGKFSFKGSGSLITSKHVLTSASMVCSTKFGSHKFILSSPALLKLVLGALNIDEASNEGSKEINGDQITKIILHPNAGYNPLIASFAIILMNVTITRSSFIIPVCLWPTTDNVSDIQDRKAFAVGYGEDENGKLSGTKKHAIMVINNQTYCEVYWKPQLAKVKESRFFCAQAQAKGTACYRDNSIYIKHNSFWFLRGVLNDVKASANGICSNEKPALYEDVAFYREWVQSQISLH